MRGAAKRNGETTRGAADNYVRGAAKRATATNTRGGTAKYVGGTAKRNRETTRGAADGYVGGTAMRYAAFSCVRWRPKPSISSSTTSPGLRYGFGSGWPMATPAGVPVLMTSPGYRVMNWLT